MLSLYAQYVLERTDDLIIENDKGFATYRYIDDKKTVYIVDIFIVPGERRSGEASRLANAIVKEAKDRGCNKLIGSVVPSTHGSSDSIRALMAYGMTLDSCSNDFILFKKDI